MSRAEISPPLCENRDFPLYLAEYPGAATFLTLSPYQRAASESAEPQGPAPVISSQKTPILRW
jgi:hypothetical protein